MRFAPVQSGSVDHPRGLYPLIAGPKELEYDTWVAQGLTILNAALQQQLADGSHSIKTRSPASASYASASGSWR
jgi:hypothetical protein